MKEALKGLLQSKKAVMTLIGMLSALLSIPLVKLLNLPPDQAAQVSLQIAGTIVVLGLGYVGGQGLADIGKEAAKEKAKALEAGKKPDKVNGAA